MADVKQQPAVTRGGIPGGNPMNLTCKPVSGAPTPGVTATAAGTASVDNAAAKYAVIMNATGAANPPNNSWTTTVFVSTDAYLVQSSDGSIDFTIPAGGLGIYSK